MNAKIARESLDFEINSRVTSCLEEIEEDIKFAISDEVSNCYYWVESDYAEVNEAVLNKLNSLGYTVTPVEGTCNVLIEW